MSVELEAWRTAHYVPDVSEMTEAEILTAHAQMDNPPDMAFYLVMLAREEA